MEQTTSTPIYKNNKIIFTSILVFTIFLSNVVAGLFIARSIYQWRTTDSYVSVKGIAERSVKADLAIWDIGYKITGDNLSQLTAESLRIQNIVSTFLTKNKFETHEIEQQGIEVLDQYAKEYQSDKAQHRYIITGRVTLRTTKVDLVHQVSQTSAELIQQGIVLANKNESMPNPCYLFTKLDDIRPQMLEQATKSARLVAEQFATNSNSKLGSIRRASQGIFQILSIDSNAGQDYGSNTNEASNINKTVRIVVSIDYMLKN